MRAFRVGAVLALLGLGGCASVTRFNGLPLAASDGLYVNGVTPIHQDSAHGCGAACVAAVATHWGVGLDQFETHIGLAPGDTTAQQLQAMAEKLGLRAFAFQGSMEDLRDNLQKGRPLIVMIPMPIVANAGLVGSAVSRVWNEVGPRPAHWVVVVGLLGDRVLVHDPASGPLQVRTDHFRRWWAEKDNLCVLIAKTE